jgi:hypothetical protein
VGEEEAKKAEDGPQSGQSKEATGGGSGAAQLLRDAASRLLPIFLTGASLIGFVAFAGAVIVWTRFDAIGVPPEQAVKAVSRDELVATGSSLLLLFGFFGVLALVATYLVDRGGRATPGMSRALLLVVALEGIIAIVLVDDVSILLRVGVCLGFLVLVGLAIILTFDTSFAAYADVLKARDGETEVARRGPDSLHDYEGNPRLSIWAPVRILLVIVVLGVLAAELVFAHHGDLVRIAAWFLVVWFVLGLVVLFGAAWMEIEASRATERKLAEDEAYEVEAYAEDARREEPQGVRIAKELWRMSREGYESYERFRHPQGAAEVAASGEASRLGRRRPHRLVLRFWGICVFLLLALAAIVGPAAILGQWWLAVSFGAAFILATGVWRVAVLTRTSFIWFGLAVFISVPLFGTCTLMARNVSHPQVQPMAMIRSSDGPGESIQGIYVAESNNRVYFANVATEGCENKVTPGSGRLLWVPRKEVVAISVGPTQNLDDAGRAALEMAFALTPDVETSNGESHELGAAQPATEPPAQPGQVAGRLKVKGEKPEGKKGNAEDAKGKVKSAATPAAPDKAASEPPEAHRLEGAGPAIRPDFGSGLRLVPAEAEPGDVVELRMSAPNNAVNGFGDSPEHKDLRLNGVRLAVLRIPAQTSEQAEYVKTVGGQVLPAEWYEEEVGGHVAEFVRLEGRFAAKVSGEDEDHPLSLRLAGQGRLAPVEGKRPNVILTNGAREELRYGLLQRAWSRTRIKFRVPEKATTGVVSVDCGQLAGQPLLSTVHPPIAHVAVRMHPGSSKVILDSSRSVVDGKAKPSRHWTIAGRRMGDEPTVEMTMPPRLAPYSVHMTVSSAGGLSDTVELQVLRLPSSRFPFGADRAEAKKSLRRVLRALHATVDRQAPVAVELDGGIDGKAKLRKELRFSYERAERLREHLFKSAQERASSNTGGITAIESSSSRNDQGGPPSGSSEPLSNHGAPIPILIRAFGESCPIARHHRPRPINGRVEVFLLGPGATVATGKGCHPGRIRRISW